MKCRFEKDVHGFYITPLIGISNIHGDWSFWAGWFYWLWTVDINRLLGIIRRLKNEM